LERDNQVIVSQDVIVDKRAKGSDPKSKFEVDLVEALREKLGLNGEPVCATQNPWEETPNGKKDGRKDKEVEEDTGAIGKIGGTGRV
jgi:hypothetical protein